MTTELDLSFDEICATLRHSDLSTIITEGRDDYSLFRNLQQELGAGHCLPAGGGKCVLKLHRVQHTFSCPRVAFLMDRDLWLHSGVPDEIERSKNAIVTDGYSIENDALRDAQVERLIYRSEIDDYNYALDALCRWFSAGVAARLEGVEFSFDERISKILDADMRTLSEFGRNQIEKLPSRIDLEASIRGDYQKLLRGKTWLSLLTLIFNTPGRTVTHSPKSLLEIGVRGEGALTEKITGRLTDCMII